MVGWALVPTGAIGAFLGVRALAVRWVSNWPGAQALLVSVNAVVLLTTTLALRISAPGWAVVSTGSLAPLPPSIYGICAAFLLGFPLVNVGLLTWLSRVDAQTLQGLAERPAIAASLPLLLAGTLAAVAVQQPPAPPLLLFGASAAALALALRVRSMPKVVTRSVDALAVALLAWITLDPHLHFDAVHHHWFLGPVHATMPGQTMLVDFVAAYGVLPIHLLAMFFDTSGLPLSHLGLAAVVSVLLFGYYAATYALLRTVSRRQWVAVGAMVAALLIHFFGARASYTVYPSTGPLRFGLPLLVLLFVALRASRPSWRHATLAGEAVVVGLGALWSVETFLCVLAA